jgi:phosphoribosyl 1,2-cyclic phosphate phosphodiesterase
MKITFLGTAAATACPLTFCRCPVCRTAWKRGGKDFRRRSSVLIGEDLLIDLGPDVMSAAFDYGADMSRVRFLLQTHSHSDHFDAGHLIARLSDYAAEDTLPLTLCASPETLLHMSERLALEEDGASLMTPEWQERLNLTVCPMRHGDVIEAGGRRITAVESNHDPADGSLLWVIEEGGAAFLYATDTMKFTDRALELFRSRGFRFDAAAIDHTYGPGTPGGGHLCADEVIAEMERLRTAGVLSPSCRILATHISHEGMPLHDELSEFASAHGYEIAWDGMTVELTI